MNETQQILESCTSRARDIFPEDGSVCSARDAAYYLAHTAKGESIRALAAADGTHPSTVLRAVRRVEQNRDDPLFDRLLSDVENGRMVEPQVPANQNKAPSGASYDQPLSATEIRREAKRFLRRLCEPGAFLLITPSTEMGGIFCSANDFRRPIAVLQVKLAVEFLRNDWIKVSSRGTCSVRYRVTDVGRSFLRRSIEEDRVQNPNAMGFSDAASPFAAQHRLAGERLLKNPDSGENDRKQVNLGESPLGWLGRRKGSDGKAFLSPEEVEAGEKLRTDFECAHLGPSVAQDWRKFLTPGDKMSGTPVSGGPGEGAMAARERVRKALDMLGPGLADSALRVCCFLEGLEACERRMGWSARSAKVVLKIALQRLADHYGLAPFKG